jgi:protein TonB
MTAHAGALPGLDSRDDLRRWLLAAVIVVAAHAGLIAGGALWPPDHAPGAASAPAVILDFAPLPVAPVSPADLAPGPEMAESQPTPAADSKPDPAEPFSRLEQPADVTMPMEEPRPQETPQQRPVPRTTATAPPRSNAGVGPVPQAPSPGSSEQRAAIASWRDLVMARLQSAKRYPGGAEARRAQGTATLSFSVDRSGRVISSAIAKSSGHADLDREVLAMIRRAEPLPPFPAAMPQSVVQLSVPVRFALRR